MVKNKFRKGKLLLHFYPFQKRIEKGTPCDIIAENEEFYEVRFNLIGYGGTYSVNKSMVEEVVANTKLTTTSKMARS